MTQANPLYLPTPQAFLKDPELQTFYEVLKLMLDQLWERTGGEVDVIESTTTQVTALDGSIEAAEANITALQSSVSALQTTVNAIATGTPVYAPANKSTDRTWDCDQAAGTISATPTQAEVENIRDAVLEISDVLATLADDLQTKGIVG